MDILGKILPGAAHLQNPHPLIVHFPLAFLMAAGIIYILAYGFHRDSWARMAFWCLVLGSFTALIAVASGLYAQEGVMVAPSVRAHLLNDHRQLMLVTLGLSIVLALWAALTGGFPKKGRPLFVLSLIILMAVMTKGADEGGRMVYDYNAGGYACSQPIEFSK